MKTMSQMLLAVALSACGASGSKGLSVSAKGTAAKAAASPIGSGAAALSGSSTTAAVSAPTIQRVRLVISDLELGAAAQAFEGGTGSTRIVPGPIVVDLDAAALAGGVVRKLVDALDVPPGEYAYARFRVRPLDASEASVAPDLVGLSVKVDGTIDGAPFTFTSSLTATIVLPGRFEIGMDDMNLTLALDVSSWFAPGGVVLDPRVDANRAAIEARIVASLVLFGDHDRDGREDAAEGEGMGGGHG